ncbi:MAG: phage tail tape measure protein, partial [Peptococcaceae bacterium]|nr:phage tail tape measure protein [Peptococcaceae bacterium]
MTGDDSFIKIISRIGIDYSQAVKGTKDLAEEIQKLNRPLDELAAHAKQTAAQVAAAFNQTAQAGATSIAKQNRQILQQNTVFARDYFTSVENRARQHRAFMDRLFSPQMTAHHLNWLIAGVGIYGTFEVLKEGLVDVEKGMKGLMTVLPEIAHDQEAYNQATKESIDLMQKYGASVEEVMSAGRSFGRMYKEVETVMGLVNNSILLNVIDNVKLEQAVRGTEAALAVYGKELKSTNEVLAFSSKFMDSLTRLSHESMASATDLIEIIERSAAAAKNAKTDIDQLMGVGAAAVRATGLPGANIGNMLKTVFAQLSAPTKKVREEIEQIGVKLYDANGQLRSAYDIILDLARATKDATISQDELNEAILKAASGKFQYSKLSSVLGQFDEIVKNTSRSIHAQGITMQMAAQQLDTIERHAKMLKATLLDTFSGAGDAGLRTAIKGMLDTLNQLIMGFNNVSSTAINASLALGAVILAGKMIFGIYSRVLPVIGSVTGITAQIATASNMAATGQMSLATATNVTNAAMGRLAATAALATGGLTLLLGGLTYLVYKSGEAERKQLELSQAIQENIQLSQQKIMQYNTEGTFLEQMSARHQQLTEQIDSGRLSVQELAAAQKDRAAVEEAVLLLVDDDIKKKIEANGVTQEEINLVIESVKQKKQAELEKNKSEINETNQKIRATNERIEAIKRELEAEKTLLMTKSPVRLGIEAAIQFKYPDLARLLGLGKAMGLGDKLRRLEKEYGDAQKRLTDLQMSFIQGIGDISRLGGGGIGDEDRYKLSDFTDPLREAANKAKLTLDDFNNAVMYTDTLLQGIATRERIFDLQMQGETVPTLEQARGKYALLNEIMALNARKQLQLHEAANVAREQLAELNAEMDDLVRRHESGALSTREFNAAVSALRPTIQALERDIVEYGNSWWEAELNSIQAMRTMKDFYMDALQRERDAVKEAYEDRIQEIEDEIAAEEELTQKRIEQKEDRIKAIDEETDARIKAIQELIDALDVQDTQSDREEAEREHNKKLADLQEQKQYHELRTGLEHAKAIDDINRQIAEEEHAWELKKQEWAREDQRKAYQDQIDSIREQAEARKDAIREEINDIKKASDAKKRELQRYYADIERLLSDKNLEL